MLSKMAESLSYLTAYQTEVTHSHVKEQKLQKWGEAGAIQAVTNFTAVITTFSFLMLTAWL